MNVFLGVVLFAIGMFTDGPASWAGVGVGGVLIGYNASRRD